MLLRFDGVESRYKVWVNGVEIGLGSGSRLAEEFDITGVVRSGPNLIAARVHQWSAASYLEDQDQWWLPGIFRDVTVLARPAGGLDDVWLRTEFDAVSGAGLTVPTLVADLSAFPVTLMVPELGLDLTWGSMKEVVTINVGEVEPGLPRFRVYTKRQSWRRGDSVSPSRLPFRRDLR